MMKKINTQSIKMSVVFLGFCYFVAQFTMNLDLFGLLVNSALTFKRFSGTSLIVGTNTLGAILAFFLIQFPMKFKQRDLLTFTTSLATSFLLLLNQPDGIIWFCAILLRSCMGTLILARLIAFVPNLAGTQRLVLNKKIQSLGVLAILAGSSCASIIAMRLGIASIFAIDIFLTMLAMWPCFILSKSISEKNIPQLNFRSSLILEYNLKALILQLLFCTLALWTIGGIFHIIEIPLLIERFQATPAQLTIVFTLTLLCNASLIRFFRVKTLAHTSKYMYLSCPLVIIFSLFYLYTNNFVLVCFLVCGFGVANGLFTLAQTSYVQNIDNEDQRAKIFILLRLVSQVGLLLATFITIRLNSYASIAKFLLFLMPFLLLLFILFSKKLGPKLNLVRPILIVCLIVTSVIVQAQDHKANLLRVAVQAFPSSPNPAYILDGNSALILGQVYENLYEYDNNNVLKPKLSKGHIWSSDLKELKIFIDSNHSFSDGTHLTASIVADSLKSAISVLKENGRWAFGNVAGFDKFISDPLHNVSLLGINVIDNEQLIVKFDQPFALFPSILAAPNFSIKKEGPNNLTYGTGAYVIQSMLDQSWRLRKREEFYNDNVPDEISFIKTISKKETVDFAKRGLIDIGEVANVETKDLKNYHVYSYPYLQAVILLLNTRKAPFMDAQNRCQFLADFHEANKLEGYSWQPASIGLPFSWDMFQTTASAPPLSTPERRTMETIQIDFADSVAFFDESINKKIQVSLHKDGYNVNFDQLAIGTLLQRMKKGDFQAGLISFVPDYIYPEALLFPFIFENQLYNFGRYNNSNVNTLLLQARSSVDKYSRINKYNNFSDNSVQAGVWKIAHTSFDRNTKYFHRI